MTHAAVVLPTVLLQRLKSDGAASGRGLSGEIRHRLQASYEHESRDPETRRFVEWTEELTESIARDLGVRWYQTKFAREAMKSGLEVLIGEYAAEGDSVPDVPWSGYSDDAPPNVVGQTHARLVVRARPRKPR